MFPFLGMAVYNCSWICDYAIKTVPLQALIWAVGRISNALQLQWTNEAEAALQVLKGDLQHTAAHGNPKPINLYVAKRSGYGNKVLIKDSPTGKQPRPYYSTKLDNIDVIMMNRDATLLPQNWQWLCLPTNGFLISYGESSVSSFTCVTHRSAICANTIQKDCVERCKLVNPAMCMVIPVDGVLMNVLRKQILLCVHMRPCILK